LEFCEWLLEQKAIGICLWGVGYQVRGRMVWSFPLSHDGKAYSCHMSLKTTKIDYHGERLRNLIRDPEEVIRVCRFEPENFLQVPYIVGDPKTATTIFVSESQWDVLACGDAVRMETTPDEFCLVSTWGAARAKLIDPAILNPRATIYAALQNDEPGKKWLEVLSSHLERTIDVITPPSVHKDFGDWLRAGIDPDAFDQSITTFEIRGEVKKAQMEPEQKPAANGSKPLSTGIHATKEDANPIGEHVKYVLDGKSWWALNSQCEWIPLGGTDAVRRYLKSKYALSGRTEEGENISEVDQTIHQIEMNHYADIAGRYAGYLEAGIHEVAGSKLLVPRSHRLPIVTERDCSTLFNFLQGMFTAPDQLNALFGWLQTAVRTLREDKPGEWSPGQALVLLGIQASERACCKESSTYC
jgi:hypothetical protein